MKRNFFFALALMAMTGLGGVVFERGFSSLPQADLFNRALFFS